MKKFILILIVLCTILTCKKKEFIPTPCDRDSFVIAGLTTKCMFYNDYSPDIDSPILYYHPLENPFYSIDIDNDKVKEFSVSGDFQSDITFLTFLIKNPSFSFRVRNLVIYEGVEVVTFNS